MGQMAKLLQQHYDEHVSAKHHVIPSSPDSQMLVVARTYAKREPRGGH